ncbi:AAA family ATPase [Chitinimonas arctica]|uniref:AAA family ATPase n=1 Tax=Chitinimonas arctica TaxID=2594795 RepID=A0A516SJ82_9NEIS|nr:DnaB-like helicase C-terminal domain-containing protein [Chitinimonas arctica]QDQ28222.1 AAA family ATPase [Chitinimonas arctica]
MSDTTAASKQPYQQAGTTDADKQFTQGIEKRMTRNNELHTLTTGLTDLDALLGGGLQPGQLVLVDGPPGIGKTGLGVGIALANAQAGVATAYHSLERSAAQLGARFVASASGVSLSQIKSARLSDEELSRYLAAAEQLSPMPMWFVDRTRRTVAQLTRDACKLKRERGLSLLVVDHLHLIAEDGAGLALSLEMAISRLKRLAVELDICIVLMGHLHKRPAQLDAYSLPSLTDLRYLSVIEHYPDVVLLLHRSGYYDPTVDQTAADIVLAKHRMGKTGVVLAAWQSACARFVDASPAHYTSPDQRYAESAY